MPKQQLLRRRYWDRFEERQERLGAGVREAWLAEDWPFFIDYWDEIPGTLPEKMVFDALVRMRINFKFSWYLGDLKITPNVRERVRPDFILIDFDIIIEVAGVYWHSRPGMFERDAWRAALLEASGWSVRTIADLEILELGAKEAVLRVVPEIASTPLHGNLHMVGDRPFDPVAALAARLKKWPRQFEPRVRVSRKGIRAEWEAWEGPRRPAPAYGPIFLGQAPHIKVIGGGGGRKYKLYRAIQNYYTRLKHFDDGWSDAEKYSWYTRVIRDCGKIISLMDYFGLDAKKWHEIRSQLRQERNKLKP